VIVDFNENLLCVTFDESNLIENVLISLDEEWIEFEVVVESADLMYER
jgi:hypothetical protein